MEPRRPASRLDFTIAIICALTIEADAVEALFDHSWDDVIRYSKSPGDINAYSTGVIGHHNIVLAYMPDIGKANAASVAAYCSSSFPNIKLALVVGVCGVVPFTPKTNDEIILGDVLLSTGIIQYDFGRRYPDCFIRKNNLDALGRQNMEIRALLAKLKGLRSRRELSNKMVNYLKMLQQESELQADYPGVVNDRLFSSDYRHLDANKTCEAAGCNGEIISRSRFTQQTLQQPKVHFGIIASGDTVIKDAKTRDEIADREGVIGFEMEGNGVWDIFPCIVIKGACDYADSHKTKTWQRYAAATAAACTKAFLEYWASPGSDERPATNGETRRLPWILAEADQFIDKVKDPQAAYALAVELYKQKEYGKAELQYRQAIEEQRQVLGDYHKDTVRSIYWLAHSLQAQKKLNDAGQQFQKVVEAWKQILGEYHRDTMQAMYWLGRVLYEQQRLSDAELQLQQAFEAQKQSLGVSHEETLYSAQFLGHVFYDQGKFIHAEVYYQQAAQGLEQLLGQSHERTLYTNYWFGRALYSQQKFSAAELQFQKAAKGFKETLPHNHKDTLEAVYWTGCALFEQHRIAEAEQQFQIAFEGQRETLGADQEDTLKSVYWLNCCKMRRQEL